MTEEHELPGHMRARRMRALPWFFAFGAIIMASLTFISTPYYIMRPGSAVVLSPIIQVEDGNKDSKGEFMLTTVRMGEARLFWYLYSYLSPDAELVEKKQVLSEGESDEDFTRREQTVMQDSQKVAEAVAFRLAGYPVKVENHGITVMATLAGYPAREKLKVGDVIIAADGKETLESKPLQEYLRTKKVGDKVKLTILRDEKELEVELVMAEITDGSGKHPGIGIELNNYQQIDVPKDVTIASQNIGGPSAGLMFTLEIYDQLQDKSDLTHGYKIAGTGTMSIDGSVGRIGGINHKIIAADNAGAELFFAPNDTGYGTSNYEEALATAKRIGTKMKIVPVKTVNDAVRYLSTLPPKQS